MLSDLRLLHWLFDISLIKVFFFFFSNLCEESYEWETLEMSSVSKKSSASYCSPSVALLRQLSRVIGVWRDLFKIQILCFYLIPDISSGVPSNWPSALQRHHQQTSQPCLQSMISSLVSFLLVVVVVVVGVWIVLMLGGLSEPMPSVVLLEASGWTTSTSTTAICLCFIKSLHVASGLPLLISTCKSFSRL